MGYRIAQTGSFDVENFGDLLFSDVFEKQMKKRLDCEVVFFSPDGCQIPGRNEITHSLSEMHAIQKEKGFDACVIGGGDLIHFGKMPMVRPFISEKEMLYNAPSMWIVPALISQKYDIPLMLNAPGVPANFSDCEANVVRNLFAGASYLSVRDENAKEVLAKAADREKIQVVPDTVLTISEIFPKETLTERLHRLYPDLKEGQYLTAQLNYKFDERDRQAFVNTLKEIRKETGWDILIQPIGWSMGDVESAEGIRQLLPEDFHVCSQHMSQYDLLAVLSHGAFYIGSSLHGAIVSTSYGVRAVVCNVNHYNKSRGFMKLLDREDACCEDMTLLKQSFDMQANREPADITALTKRIHEHFDRMAEIIRNREQPESGFDPFQISEQLFLSSNYELGLVRLANEREQRIHELETENTILRNMYNETMNSTSWKITAPLRKLKNRGK